MQNPKWLYVHFKLSPLFSLFNHIKIPVFLCSLYSSSILDYLCIILVQKTKTYCSSTPCNPSQLNIYSYRLWEEPDMRGACLPSRRFPKMFASFLDNFDECQEMNDKSLSFYPRHSLVPSDDVIVFYYLKMSLDLGYP